MRAGGTRSGSGRLPHSGPGENSTRATVQRAVGECGVARALEEAGTQGGGRDGPVTIPRAFVPSRTSQPPHAKATFQTSTLRHVLVCFASAVSLSEESRALHCPHRTSSVLYSPRAPAQHASLLWEKKNPYPASNKYKGERTGGDEIA